MERKAIITLVLLTLLMSFFLPAPVSTAEGGLLPSLTETVGIAMPSLGEALGCYPDGEKENGDGSITELYINVSESDFNAFSVYLQQQEAELADYNVEKGILTAEIRARGATFSLSYDSKKGEARVTYPSGTFDERTKNAKTHFDAAQKLLAEGRKDEASAQLIEIPQYSIYKPVASLLKTNNDLATAVAQAEKKKKYQTPGSYVLFGTYPQTNGGKDDTPIEWLVLEYDQEENKTLLLSRYGLDAKPYNTSAKIVTWEKCTLRKWLNQDFLKKAFNKKEQSAIVTTNVDNSSTQHRGYGDGNNTQDKIFLLSYAEVKKYLGDLNEKSETTKLIPTDYAIKMGAWTNKEHYTTKDGTATGSWWLRSTSVISYGDYEGERVHADGGYSRFRIDDGEHCVRPAIWLSLNSNIF